MDFAKDFVDLVVDAVLAVGKVDSPARVLFGLVVLVGAVRLVWCTLACVLCCLGGLLPRKSVRKYGSWAVVTGATDGIGLGACLFRSRPVAFIFC